MSDPLIRGALETDIGTVLALWKRADAPPSVTDSEDGLRRLLGADPDALLIAESGGVPVGSLIAAWDGWRASFYRLAVDPGRRREGIASAMLIEGERRLRSRGAVRFTAVVAADSAAATGFWKAAGYDPQHDRTRFVRQPQRPHP